VLLTADRPEGAIQFKEGTRGCVGAMLLAAAKGRAVVFDRRTFGYPGGGVGLGFGDCYRGFPIERLRSTGGQAALAGGHTFDMGEGERYMASPEVVGRWGPGAALLYDAVRVVPGDGVERRGELPARRRLAEAAGALAGLNGPGT